MSVKKFRFVSPGIFINEIDNSQLPKEAGPVGPVIIGRTARGPGMRPVQVNSFSEFVEIFGNPIAGGQGGDIWRNGNYTAPAYAGYAAQAWLRNATPCTVVRLLGTHNETRNDTAGADAGWQTIDSAATGGGTYGLFVGPPSGGVMGATLAAVIYLDDKDAQIGLVGKNINDGTNITDGASDWATGQWIKSTGKDYGFTIHVGGENKSFDLNRNSKKFIRNILNTNPTLVNTAITTNTEEYFLGETFEHTLDFLDNGYWDGDYKSKGGATGVLLPLEGMSGALDKNLMELQAQPSRTPWIFSQHTGNFDQHIFDTDKGTYKTGVKNLFRLVGLNDGAWSSSNLKVSIADIKAGTDIDPYGTFTVMLRKINDTDAAPKVVERYTGCNLNPNSSNYVAKKIGDMETTWSYTESRYTTTGQHPNLSKFVRVEVESDVESGSSDAALCPFGFVGTSIPRSIVTPAAHASPLTAKTITNEAGTPITCAVGNFGIGASSGGKNSSDTAGVSPYYDNGSPHEIHWPWLNGVSSSSDAGLSNGKDTYFGINFNKPGTNVFDEGVVDCFKAYSQTNSYREHSSSAANAMELVPTIGFPGGDENRTSLPATASLTFANALSAADEVVIKDVKGSEITFILEEDSTTTDGSVTPDAKAAVTYTFTGLPSDETTVTITDYEGTSVIFEIDDDDDGAATSGAIAMDPASSDPEALATIIYSSVNASDLKITATNPEDGVVTLTQDSIGPEGNQAIGYSNQSGWSSSVNTPVKFTGGANAGEVKFGANAVGVGSKTEQATALFKAINSVTEYNQSDNAGSSTNYALNVTATNGSDNVVILTQDMAGTAGNDSTLTTTVPNSDVAVVAFAGGSNGIDGFQTSDAPIGANMNQASTSLTAKAYAFTLDDLMMNDFVSGSDTKKSQQHVTWIPGARYAGASVTVRGTTAEDYAAILADPLDGPNNGSHKSILEHGFNKFTMPLVGGFDGLDIREKEPFRNTLLSEKSEQSHYAYNSVKRAIDSVADPEVVEMNLAVIPGCTNKALTAHLINTCESRGDALAVIDLEGDYTPNTEGLLAESSRLPEVTTTINNLKDRAINSSYGCAYFPWVQIKDTVSDSTLWSPPSVVALGTMASSQRKSELWFSPAGFNRGGLTEGSAGVPVTQARRRLTSKDRDRLYEANINPIASFPSEGLVIFGQKTLQVTPSALDRINVRRLLIFLKKEISTISAGILFDNNVPATWHRFTSKVEPLLASVKNRFGLSDFKVILDETTTTPDLIDRNILYAKIMLKPARSIEFIAIDFVITRTGASFDD